MDKIFKNIIVRKIYGIIMTFLAIISVIIAIADFRNKGMYETERDIEELARRNK